MDRDKVFAVFSSALDVLTFINNTFIPEHKLGKTGAQTVAEKTHYVLITRTGDTAGVDSLLPAPALLLSRID